MKGTQGHVAMPPAVASAQLLYPGSILTASWTETGAPDRISLQLVDTVTGVIETKGVNGGVLTCAFAASLVALHYYHARVQSFKGGVPGPVVVSSVWPAT